MWKILPFYHGIAVKTTLQCRGWMWISFLTSLSVRFLDLLFAKIGGVEKALPIEGSLESICQCFLTVCLICWDIGEKVVDNIIDWPVGLEEDLGVRRPVLFNGLILDIQSGYTIIDYWCGLHVLIVQDCVNKLIVKHEMMLLLDLGPEMRA